MLRIKPLVMVAAWVACSLANAVTLRVANPGDATSMDPHSLNESLQLSITGNVYEPLVGRDRKLTLEPALATKWSQTSPTLWRFDLRKGVKFHDGTPLTADDVVFSFGRAAGEGSDMRGYTSSIKQVRKVDDATVEIETTAPFPILPDVISLVYIMSKKWCEDNKAERPVDKRKGIENTASFRANGTGPYRLRERQPTTRSTFTRNAAYWGKVEGNVDEVIFTPIGNDATRVAAMLSGEIDVMEPVPLQDVERLKSSPTLTVMQGPELRTIFLGMDQSRDELLFSDVKGKNPFKDVRVRKAIYQAIDIETIKRSVMRNASWPAGTLLSPYLNGSPTALNKRALPYDPEASKKLLAEAGYPQGFSVGLQCPNDRYVYDEAICVALSSMLARVGIKTNLMIEPTPRWSVRLNTNDVSFYMVGHAGLPMADSYGLLKDVVHTRTQKEGSLNAGRYSNPKFDALLPQIASEIDAGKRNALIEQAVAIERDDVSHIPLHQQPITWAARKGVTMVQGPDNQLRLWLIRKAN